MDHFGIGAGVLGAVETYITAARRTGRTTSLMDSLKSGDRVVCRTQGEANDLDMRCRERGLKVDFVILPVGEPQVILYKTTSTGRTVFDHTWLEEYYRKGVLQLQSAVDFAQREASGYGAAHYETKRQAMEIAKWRP